MSDSTLIVYRLHRKLKQNERRRADGTYTNEEADKWNEYNFTHAALLWDKHRFGSKQHLASELLARIVLKAIIGKNEK